MIYRQTNVRTREPKRKAALCGTTIPAPRLVIAAHLIRTGAAVALGSVFVRPGLDRSQFVPANNEGPASVLVTVGAMLR